MHIALTEPQTHQLERVPSALLGCESILFESRNQPASDRQAEERLLRIGNLLKTAQSSLEALKDFSAEEFCTGALSTGIRGRSSAKGLASMSQEAKQLRKTRLHLSSTMVKNLSRTPSAQEHLGDPEWLAVWARMDALSSSDRDLVAEYFGGPSKTTNLRRYPRSFGEEGLDCAAVSAMAALCYASFRARVDSEGLPARGERILHPTAGLRETPPDTTPQDRPGYRSWGVQTCSTGPGNLDGKVLLARAWSGEPGGAGAPPRAPPVVDSDAEPRSDDGDSSDGSETDSDEGIMCPPMPLPHKRHSACQVDRPLVNLMVDEVQVGATVGVSPQPGDTRPVGAVYPESLPPHKFRARRDKLKQRIKEKFKLPNHLAHRLASRCALVAEKLLVILVRSVDDETAFAPVAVYPVHSSWTPFVLGQVCRVIDAFHLRGVGVRTVYSDSGPGLTALRQLLVARYPGEVRCEADAIHALKGLVRVRIGVPHTSSRSVLYYPPTLPCTEDITL